MKRITLMLVLLLTVSAHAEEQSLDAQALQEQLQAVERQLVRSGITEAEARATLRSMIQARFTVEQVTRVGKQLVSDDLPGITGQAVRDKIHEGVAKGVSPENILSATERVRTRVELAGKLAAEVNAADKVQVVSAYLDCLAAGLTEQHAHQINIALGARTGTSASVGGPSLTMETLLAAREMVRRSISSATAAGVLGTALGRGYTDKEMRSLRQSIAGSSGDPENTARRFGAAIDQGMRVGELQGLGGSGRGTGERSGVGQGGSGGSGGCSSGSSGSSGGSGSGNSGGRGGSGGGNGRP